MKTPLVTEPAISAGFIFLPTPGDRILIVEAESGRLASYFQVGGPVAAPPAIQDSFVVVNEYGRRMMVGNWVDGSSLWAVDLYGSEFAPVVFENRVYWHDGRHGIFCFDITEGRRIWGLEIPFDITAPPAASSEGLLFATDAGRIQCYSLVDGTSEWHVESGGRVKAQPVISNGRFAYSTVDGNVTLADMADGQALWSTDLYVPVVASMAMDETGLYVCANQGQVYKVALSDGAIVWNSGFGGPIKGGPSILGNVIVLATLNHAVIGVDKNEGKVMFEHGVDGMVSSRPVACGDRVYVAGEDENLYCFKMLRTDE
jgi:outer membrane protein assembly factor BamB